MKNPSYDNVSATTSPQLIIGTLQSHAKIQTATMTRTMTDDYPNTDYVYSSLSFVNVSYNHSSERVDNVKVDQRWEWDVNKRIEVGSLLVFLLVVITVCQNVCAKRLYQSWKRRARAERVKESQTHL